MNFVQLAVSLPQILIAVVGFLGALTLSYAVFLEKEKNQDAVLVLSSASLFAYSLVKGDWIFMFTFGFLLIVTARELVLILLGKHHHTIQELDDYQHVD